jgi:hypothetical protein
MADADLEVTEVTVHLTLTEDEASALRDVLARVAGFMHTRRAHIEAISDALDEIGFDFDDSVEDMEGSVQFI